MRRSSRLGTYRPPIGTPSSQTTGGVVAAYPNHPSSNTIGYISIHDTVVDIVICHMTCEDNQNGQALKTIVIDDIQTVSVDHVTLLEYLLELQRKWHTTAYYCDEEDYNAINSQMMHLAMHYMSSSIREAQLVSINPVERDPDINRRHYVHYISYLQKQLYIINPVLLQSHMTRDALQSVGTKGIVDAISGATEVLNLYAGYR